MFSCFLHGLVLKCLAVCVSQSSTNGSGAMLCCRQLLLLLVLLLLLSSAAAGGAAAAAGAAAAGAAGLWKNPDSSKILMRLAVSEEPSGDGLERMTSSWVVRLKTPVAQRLIVVVVVDCVVGCGRGRGRG